MGEQRRRRPSLRLDGYDYRQEGIYFVTVCVQGRACLLGEIVAGEMRLNELGRAVATAWEWLPEQYPYVQLGEYVVMPNHLHGIVFLTDDPAEADTPVRRKALGRLVGAFKTVSTKQVNAMRGTPGAALWQRGFYDHIVRHERALDTIRSYVFNNPGGWTSDQLHPDVPSRW